MAVGFITGFLAAMLGWQINIVGIHRGLERGRSAPFLLGLGATLADLFIILIAFAGAAPILRLHNFWPIIKWIGITTILFTSFKILFHKTKFADPFEKKTRSPAKSFILGFIIVASNPAVYLMWIAIISFIFTHFGYSTIQHHLFFLLGFFTGCMTWFSTLAFFILGHIRQWGENQLHLISRISAVFLFIAAIVLIFEKF